MDNYHAYKWQEKTFEPREQQHSIYGLSKCDGSLKKCDIGSTRYSIDVKFVYNDKLLWREKIFYYVRIDNKKKIDFQLTDITKFYSRLYGKFSLTPNTVKYKNKKIVGSFDNIIKLTDREYQSYLRQIKLEKIINHG